MEETHPLVDLKDREKINVLGFIMEEIMVRALNKDRGKRILSHLRGFLLISASSMTISIGFLRNRVTIVPGRSGEGLIRGKVYGTLSSLSELASLGKLLLDLIGGKIRVGGNPVFLLLSFLMIREGIRG